MTPTKRKTSGKGSVVVGLSGGVDSSLAAALLKRQGYSVIGVTFRMWPKEECGNSQGRACCNLESIVRARAVAEDLKIPYYVMDYSADFKREVIDYFCGEYRVGRTPNPCVMCNEKIKFGRLLEKALSLGAGKVATGHYANIRLNRRTSRYLLLEGADKSKDQSYFLFSLSQRQLACSVFPLGSYTKAKTRKLAKRLGLKTHNTVSSQDVCFIQGKSYGEYIEEKAGVGFPEGDIVSKEGKVLGKHRGIPFYTIGQRKGLGIAHCEPLYVTEIDVGSNRIIVGTKKSILKTGLIAERMNWISISSMEGPLKVKARIRYNHKKAPAVVSKAGIDSVKVVFNAPQEAPTPGQAIVFYDKDIVIGGGWIKESFDV